MAKIAKYILNSDFATLANDSDTTEITVSIPATSIGSGSTQTYSSTATLGTIGAPIEMDINYSMTSQRYVGDFLFVVENDTVAGDTYYISTQVYRSSSTAIKVLAVAYKPGAGSVTKTARTITVKVRSFLPPFS